jgi:RNA polymerase sigma-70 factor (ECF subfamily)
MSTAVTGVTDGERVLLAAARGGDEQAYRSLVEPHRAELHAHCYRMLGSVHDAEDALQDALLRAWRGLRGFEGRSSIRAWLYRITTNTCLDVVARRPKRVLPLDFGPAADLGEGPGAPLVESVWIEPYADERLSFEDTLAAPEARYEQRESLELAFVAALQQLPPRQRAVLILREVLGFSAREVADSLGTTVASVNSALQRARKTVDERRPEESQQANLRALGDERIREVVARYMDAMERADVGSVLALLTQDATWSMPPLTTWYSGLDAITGFLTDHALSVNWRHLPTRANGQLAVGCYSWDSGRKRYLAAVIDVLTLRGGRIAEITAFLTSTTLDRWGHEGTPFVTAEVFPQFGLPLELPASR